MVPFNSTCLKRQVKALFPMSLSVSTHAGYLSTDTYSCLFLDKQHIGGQAFSYEQILWMSHTHHFGLPGNDDTTKIFESGRLALLIAEWFFWQLSNYTILKSEWLRLEYIICRWLVLIHMQNDSMFMQNSWLNCRDTYSGVGITTGTRCPSPPANSQTILVLQD